MPGIAFGAAPDSATSPSDQQAQAGVAPPEATVAQPNILQEVIVTSARDREESVQSTPVAVSALSKSMLEAFHVSDFSDLNHLAPNLQMRKQLGTGDVTTIFLRGFGTITNDPAIDPEIAIYVDGVYQPTVNGTDFDLFDIEKIEVLRGPQGTLLGKNAPTGAVSITTKRPTGEFGGEVQVDYGSFDRIETRARVDFPIIPDVLSGKISLVEKEGGGYIKDIAQQVSDLGGENSKTGRFGLLFTPNSNFEWYLSGDAELNRDPQAGVRNVDRPYAVPPLQAVPLGCSVFKECNPDTTPYTTRSNFTKAEHIDTFDVTSNIKYRMDAVSLTSVTGYRSYWGINNQDVDGLPENVLTAYQNKQRYDSESQELRLSSNKGGGLDLDGHLDWIVGGYFSHEQYALNQQLAVVQGAVPTLHFNNNDEVGVTDSEALFLHAVYNFTDQWSGSFGVRQSWDHKDHNFVANGFARVYEIPAGFHNTSFEVGSQYQFTEDKMAYVRFAQGYHAGGYVGLPGTPSGANLYDPETVNSYEIGFKTDWLDKRLRVNLDFFYSEYSDLQRTGTKPIPVAPFFNVVTINAASASVKGAELELTAIPIDPLTLSANVGYLRARYDKYFADVLGTGTASDFSGFQFAFAPLWTINLSASYTFDIPDVGTATPNVNFDYRTAEQTAGIPYPLNAQPALGLVNAGVTFRDLDERYALTVYGHNILNRHYLEQISNNSLSQGVIDGLPATWGITLSAKF